MTRRLPMVAGVATIVLLVLTLAMATSALSDSSTSTDGGNRQVVLRLADKFADDDEVEIDVGERGFGAGDYFVFGDDPVFNRARRLGVSSGECIATDVGRRSLAFHCDVVFELERGSVVTNGMFRFSEDASGSDQTFAVTGGTGAYRTALGEMDVAEDRRGLLFTLRLFL